MKWTNGENGPTCFCGRPTVIMVADDGEVNLLCFAHSGLAGALFPMPKDKRPDNWPNLNDAEMATLVDEGFAEQGLNELEPVFIDVSKLAPKKPDKTSN